MMDHCLALKMLDRMSLAPDQQLFGWLSLSFWGDGAFEVMGMGWEAQDMKLSVINDSGWHGGDSEYVMEISDTLLFEVCVIIIVHTHYRFYWKDGVMLLKCFYEAES